jgi:hypothetical protein
MRDLTAYFWLLKIGALLNLYLLLDLPETVDPRVLIPARIFLGVSAFRCLFPVWYGGNIVFHDSPASSIFLTRTLATFSEVAYIFQFSEVLRRLAPEGESLIAGLSWLMVAAVVVSQGFVWSAIACGRSSLYFWEELGWFVLFAANTVASVLLWLSMDEARLLLGLNLVFGTLYLPWQTLHLRSILARASEEDPATAHHVWTEGLRRALLERNRSVDAEAWGGPIGLMWMTAYWATLIPLWVYTVAWNTPAP